MYNFKLKINKKTILLLMFFFLFSLKSVFAFQGRPIILSFDPIDKQDYQVGDIINVRANAIFLVESEKAKVFIDLTDGLKKVDGKSLWTGSISAGEEIRLDIKVTVKRLGKQVINGIATIESSGGSVVSGYSSIVIGKNKKKSRFPIKKDRFGRSVIEYPGKTSITYHD